MGQIDWDTGGMNTEIVILMYPVDEQISGFRKIRKFMLNPQNKR